MPTDNLRSADDFRAAITVYDEKISLASSVDEVWAELAAGDHRFLPGVSVDWVTPGPHGVGTLRIMNWGPVHLRSRYFEWDEANRYKAFYLENPPVGVTEFVEYYHVTPSGSGSVVSFRLAVIPKPLIRPLMPALSAWITFLMRNWQVRFVRRRFGRMEPQRG
ncbi:SRPBCC family protein [Mycolicibacterium sp. P9-64]|uniref:SRPBCC family protein n=1 Tax=Mycolicibacterium sp. P9-64 TaxID=2024612 RepID=UPI0015634209|nr:SRPBCC family protein [Mycolicibacterium sp. P9-64]